MPKGPDSAVRSWIETFQAQSRLELHPLWQAQKPDGNWDLAEKDPWAARHRPDWHARGLLSWPRGGRHLHLRLTLHCPPAWRQLPPDRKARLLLRWWADAAELRVDGQCVHQGDLFDTACRWLLPRTWWQGRPLQLELLLRSPLHDDGALISSAVEQEPLDPADPQAVLAAQQLALLAERATPVQQQQMLNRLKPLDPREPNTAVALRPWLQRQQRPAGSMHVLGHAHLDLAWLWPVADTWQAALRTFESVLALIDRDPQFHFAHSTPALYAWIEQHRPDLFARLRVVMQAGRFEPINGPWVESDCVLVGTASLLQQFELGQAYSRSRFPEWRHHLCWLPDSFGFSAGLPALARAAGVEWFCTHKLAWNATTPFPHRLFRWRSRCSAEVLSLLTAPIGTDGDPLAMERYRLAWHAATGVNDALWLPGVGDHGGGPTLEMLEQLRLWEHQPVAVAQQHGTLRAYLARLEPLRSGLPVWRDELYLELHRGCATSRPDQKRHNRSLERLLREADLACALLTLWPEDRQQPAPATADWRALLFQQFHDIRPGSSIPEVFEQAEPQWRAARRQARQVRDQALRAVLPAPSAAPSLASAWWLVSLQLRCAGPLTLRVPPGCWQIAAAAVPLPQQPASAGGVWLQLSMPAGVSAVALRRSPPLGEAAANEVSVHHPVQLQACGDGGWRIGNGLLEAQLGDAGVEQLWDAHGLEQLAAPLAWCRWLDHGEFWDAWDIAANYRDKPLPLQWLPAPELAEVGPLCTRLVWRGMCGVSPLRLDVQLRAASPWLELVLQVDWRQRHELLRLELPLAQRACRYAADGPGGVWERPAQPLNPREKARWEVPVVSWMASQVAGGGGLAVLLDGPQGVSATQERLGVSLLRAPTWPDPSADEARQRLRVALMPCLQGWRQQAVPLQAQLFREPVWLAPAAGEVPSPRWSALSFGAEALQMVHLLPIEGTASALLVLQNLSPTRQRVSWPPGVCAQRQLAASEAVPQDADGLAPWQIGRWRISALPHQSS